MTLDASFRPDWIELSRTPRALFLDIDGTLVEFESHPDLVRATQGLIAAAARCVRRPRRRTRAALRQVAGRHRPRLLAPGSRTPPACTARRSAAPSGLGDTSRRPRGARAAARSRRRASAGASRGVGGGQGPEPGAALPRCTRRRHASWRSVPNASSMSSTVFSSDSPACSSRRCVRPTHDKGLALIDLMSQAPFAGRSPIVVGDDRTDEFAFAAAQAMGGLAILVGDRTDTHAQLRLPDPAAVRGWLAELIEVVALTSDPERQSLKLGVVGNGTIGALIDREGRYVWRCLPHLAADPAFCTLLNPSAPRTRAFSRSSSKAWSTPSQHYLPNTAVLVTTLEAEDGTAVEITDFAPRFHQWDRLYHPVMFIRRIRPLSGRSTSSHPSTPAGRVGRTCPRAHQR